MSAQTTNACYYTAIRINERNLLISYFIYFSFCFYYFLMILVPIPLYSLQERTHLNTLERFSYNLLQAKEKNL